MATNITTCNNLVVSANQTISGNIISTGNIQTSNISSTNINNSNSISTNSINATTISLTNLSVSNILTLLSNTPIIFNYNSNNYNLSTLMLFRLQELGGISIASQSYVNTQISNLVNSSPDLLNTLSELSAAINNDASFSTTITNLIATKASLTGNNNFSGATNTFSNLPYFVNTSDQLINKAYVDGRFTSLLSANNSFTGSNTFSNDTTGNIINRLFTNILAINNNNTRRSTNDILEVATSSTGNYLYYNNSSTFGFINTSNSNNSWFINSSGSATIPSITTPTGAITTLTSTTLTSTNLYSNILSINNGNALRSINDLFNVSISSTGNYLYYNNSSVFGHINTSNSALNWSINSSGLASFPSLNTPSGAITTLTSTTGTITTLTSTTGAITTLTSTTGTINNLYSNILSINNGNALRAINDLFNVSISSTGNYLYYNNSSAFGNINTSNSALSWSINSSGSASFPSLNTPSGAITTLTSTTGTITNLYSDILAVNNNNTRRAINDIFEVATSSTGNYLYYNTTSVFGHINVTNSNNSWFINQNGSAQFPSLNVSGVLSTSTLAVGSSSVRGGSGDLFTVSVTPNGDYLYLNNGGALGIYKSNGDPYFFPWIIDVNGNCRFRAFRSNNALNCYPNIITSVSSDKTLGLTDIIVTTIILEPFYDNTITISSPISLYRQYRNNSANSQLFNRLYDTLNSVSYTILKNGSTFTSGTCSTNNTLNREIYVTTNSTTSSTYHEIYIANAECSFTPSISSTSDTYIVNYTVSYSQTLSWQSYNLIIESFGYNVNTDVSGRDGNIQGGTNGPGSNYSSFNYSLSTSNYSTNSSQLQINKIVSNSIQNQNTITTNNLKCNNLLLTQQMTPAYMLDGTKQIGFNWHPITCSQYKLKAPDLDDNYIVYPGYKLNLYYNDGYNSYAGTIDNYSGTTLRYVASVNIYGGQNQINSCRLYFLNDSNEITNDLIS